MIDIRRRDLETIKAWEQYPPGEYQGKDLFGKPHPSNVCTFKKNGYSVLISYAYNVKPLHPIEAKAYCQGERWFTLHGYCVHVWSRRSPIISVERTVPNLSGINELLEGMIVEVNNVCHHDGDNTRLPAPRMVHKFRCHLCGKEWGYDSSG